MGALWAYGERNLVNASEPRTERKVNGERTVNDMWAHGERKMNYLFGVHQELSLHFVDNQEKK